MSRMQGEEGEVSGAEAGVLQVRKAVEAVHLPGLEESPLLGSWHVYRSLPVLGQPIDACA